MSARALLCAWMVLYSFQMVQGQVSSEQVDSLVALWNSTEGSSWTDNTNWPTGDPCANNWYGITCDSSNITEIRLVNNNLNGTLPPSAIFDLPYLVTLCVLSPSFVGPSSY